MAFYRVTKEPKSIRRARSSYRYQRIRNTKITADPLCEICAKAGRTKGATQVDHILPATDRPELFFVWVNLQSLCDDCHEEKTVRENASTIHPETEKWDQELAKYDR